MKKLLMFIISAVIAVCTCMPFAACGNNESPQSESKRIIGIDSKKTYLKGKFYLANNYDLISKKLVFEFYSYDKIEKEELQGVNFDVTTTDKFELIANEYELRDIGSTESDDFYHYYVYVVISMQRITYDMRINSIILNLSGRDYIFNTDIYFLMHNYRPVFVEPESYGFNTLNAGKHTPYGLRVETRYDMTLKSVKFQTDGFEILSFDIETYVAPQTGTSEKIAEELPVVLKGKQGYQINIEAIPPQDCLYYGYELEVVVEISGVEMAYNNIDGVNGTYSFMGSALNVGGTSSY